jgi:hypothetical protein
MSNCNNKDGQMAIQLAPLVGAGIGALQQGKIDKALAGEKTYTKPKTIFGKLIGGISGRTAAAEATNMYKSEPTSQKVMGAMAGSAKTTPVTGGFSFGGEATKRTYLPFYLGAVVLGIFFFMRNRRGGRRRR